MFIIIDWANNILFNGKEFETFDNGWGYIYENIVDTDNAYDDYSMIPLSEYKE